MHPLGPFAEIDRPNVAQIMATLQVRGRARWYPAGKSGDNRRMAPLIGGLAPFIIVHDAALAARRAGADRVGLRHMQGLRRGNPQLRVPPAWIKHVVFLGAQRERSRKKAGNWGPMSIQGFQQFAHGSALSGGGRARYL
jgi:hypothetical protein